MPDRRQRRVLVAFAGWTLFVWLTRVRNVVGDDDLGTAGRAAGLALSASFVVLAALLLSLLRGGPEPLRRVTAVLAGWTVAVWLVRGAAIALGDHAAGFVVVHLVLAAVSVGLAVAAWRSTQPSSRRSRHGSVSPASREP